ncbi:hypothetical protein [Pleurocapsa sp. FMAR1]|uniref:hypothetical protein n=1 Tax=Pleurocapsa sp. FMAR1 TaxID=3040204 RepID=UPI0029C6031A|nr:hypothetical protein [Pleurocapsa sp. FMAR1]
MNPLKVLPETSLLVNKFKQTKAGEILTYEEMSKCLNFDIKDKRHIFYSAANIARKEANIELVNISGIGYKRLPNNQIAKTTQEKYQEKLRNDNLSYCSKLQSIQVKDLGKAEYTQYLSAQAILVVRQAISDDFVNKKIEAAIANDPNKILKSATQAVIDNLPSFY